MLSFQILLSSSNTPSQQSKTASFTSPTLSIMTLCSYRLNPTVKKLHPASTTTQLQECQEYTLKNSLAVQTGGIRGQAQIIKSCQKIFFPKKKTKMKIKFKLTARMRKMRRKKWLSMECSKKINGDVSTKSYSNYKMSRVRMKIKKNSWRLTTLPSRKMKASSTSVLKTHTFLTKDILAPKKCQSRWRRTRKSLKRTN